MRLAPKLPRWWQTWGAAVTILTAVASVPVLLVFWFLFGHVIETMIHQQQFHESMWMSSKFTQSSGDWPPRLCMVDDLLASGRLDGLTKRQVVDLLGPPDRQQVGISYYLGPERGFIRIDSETLVIEFGQDGRVSRAGIHRD